jgi:Ca-activated chloride channel family protein
VLLRAVTVHGREMVRGEAAGHGRTDVVSTGLRLPKAESDEEEAPAEVVCLEVTHSFSPAAGVKTSPGLPVELTVDVVDGPSEASDVAAFGLGRGWWLVGTLVVTGSLAGLLWGWFSRLRITVWRTN